MEVPREIMSFPAHLVNRSVLDVVLGVVFFSIGFERFSFHAPSLGSLGRRQQSHQLIDSVGLL